MYKMWPDTKKISDERVSLATSYIIFDDYYNSFNLCLN